MGRYSVTKIIEINPCMLRTIAGGVADCQFWHRNKGIKVLQSYISKQSLLFANIIKEWVLNSYRGMGLLVGTITAGWNEKEAAELAPWTIYRATFCDGASGGVASVYYAGTDGWKKLSGDEMLVSCIASIILWSKPPF
ncbi:hypothetical protein MUK42_21681 [Musa troglodytarum]|uniref:Uncharacterized protein n=1 Tax=Musa troglodytarum TaxID=320322 RepID=A0A9E7GB73_9LILI|nr:hypothetical protein MUK42_21681 [Musa troglodytarum]